MITLTTNELTNLQTAKANCRKYQYGSLYHKQAHKRYMAIQKKLAIKYGCDISEIQTEEKRNI